MGPWKYWRKWFLIVLIATFIYFVLFCSLNMSPDRDFSRRLKVFKMMMDGNMDAINTRRSSNQRNERNEQYSQVYEPLQTMSHQLKHNRETPSPTQETVTQLTTTNVSFKVKQIVKTQSTSISNIKAFRRPKARQRVTNMFGLSTEDYYANKDAKTYPLTLDRDYIINNKNICADKSDITVLVMVHTATDHLSRRQKIRNTYASRDLFLPAEVRVVFLLGRPTVFKQRTIQVEANAHNDIVQGDFLDTYHNLTHKAVMGLRWVYESCQNAKYVVKVDDDVIFDMWTFLSTFHDEGNGKGIWCNDFNRAAVQRRGKWAVPKEEFRDHISYPWPYCEGFVVIMNVEVIPPLFHAACESPFFWIDDVYVYGILRSKAQIGLNSMSKHIRISVFGGYCHESQLTCDVLAVSIDNVNHDITWNRMIKRSNTYTVKPVLSSK